MSSNIDLSSPKEKEQAVRRTVEQLEALLKIESGILRAESPRTIAKVALEQMARIIPSMSSTVTLFKNQHKAAVVLACNNSIYKQGETISTAAEQVEARKRGEVLLINDIAALAKVSRGIESVYQRGGRSLLAVPLLAQRKLVGILTLIDDIPGAFSEEDISITQQVGNSVAIAIHHSSLLEGERKARREADVLREVASNLSANLGQEKLLQLILSQLERVLPYDRATIFLQQGKRFTVTASRGRDIQVPGLFLETSELPTNILTVMNEQQPLIIADTKHDPAWTIYAGEEYVRCWLGVPLATKATAVGLLALDKDVPDYYTGEDAATALAFANHAAITIENANLYKEIRQHATEMEKLVTARTRELGALYEITSVFSQSVALEDALDHVATVIVDSINCEAVSIQIIDESESLLHLAAHKNLAPEMFQFLQSLPSSNYFMNEILEGDKATIYTHPLQISELSEVPLPGDASYGIAAPIRVKGKNLGILAVAYSFQAQPSREDIALVTTVADHIGVAIESDRLQKQSEKLAVLEERERLARDLHDSATQSLFSLTLFAAAAREYLSSNRLETVREQLIELENTAVQTHKEMRLLLYELRSTVLEQEGLEDALRQRLKMVEFRSGIRSQIRTNLPSRLPSLVEEALFQVANEALNNTLKHSGADSVTIDITISDSRVTMTISDNGEGFSPGVGNFSMGMGLSNMRQRVQKLEGTLHFESQPQSGTLVIVNIPLDQET